MMNYRAFGSTGLEFSEICFGTWRYASPEGVADERSRAGAAALRRAIDRGITCIHSSHEYGTRWLTGEVLKDHSRRHELHHVIKVNEPDFGEERFDRTRFRQTIERALRELHTERIAVVQHLHRGSATKATVYSGEDDAIRTREFDRDKEALVTETDRLRQEGKVGALASFPYTVPFARHAVASGVYGGLVIYLNLLETEWLELFPEMERRGMGVIGIRPLCAGMLTDKRIDRSLLPATDRLSAPEWDAKYRQLAAVRQELPREPDSWTRYAIQLSLAHPLVATSTLSINNEKQLDAALDAAKGPYPSREDLEAIHSINSRFWEKEHDT